ncbi:MAG: hypothetical protein M1825_005998 [Sarcosagium campestre]|nr:MAG: hypothetical protein M1825_005998 [Sarcosagium campestre]
MLPPRPPPASCGLNVHNALRSPLGLTFIAFSDPSPSSDPSRCTARRRAFSWGRYGRFTSTLNDQCEQIDSVIDRRQYSRRQKQITPQRSWGWRLTGSFGCQDPQERVPDANESPPGTYNAVRSKARHTESQEVSSIEKRNSLISQRIRLLSKQLDEDPYGVLFGKRNDWVEKSPIWSPHTLLKSIGWVSRSNGQFVHTQSGPDTNPRDRTDVEYEIDPITLRKVPKTHNASPPSSEIFHIPIKTYSSSTLPKSDCVPADSRETDGRQAVRSHDRVRRSATNDHEDPTGSASWLTRERFSEENSESVANASERQSSQIVKPTSVGHQHEKRIPSSIEPSSESRKEDLDLLRTSDVRAGAGIIKGSVGRTKSDESVPKRDDLEKAFNTHYEADGSGENIPNMPKHRERNNVQPNPKNGQNIQPKASRKSSPSEASASIEAENRVQSLENSYVADIVAQEATIPQVEVRSNPSGPSQGNQTSTKPLAGETISLGAEGDMSERVTMFAGRTSSDKQTIEKDAQELKDRALVREIRNIYEGEYGTIDVSHRQPVVNEDSSTNHTSLARELRECETKLHRIALRTESIEMELSRLEARTASNPVTPTEETVNISQQVGLDATGEAFEAAEENHPLGHQAEQSDPTTTKVKTVNLEKSQTSSRPVVYKVLAYDPTSQAISSAITTSSPNSEHLSREKSLGPSDVLPQLNNPALFLPHFASLNQAGYEIMSGGGDVLVFKKVRDIEPPTPASEPVELAADDPSNFDRPPPYSPVNPIDGTIATGNFASPTGFVNHDRIFPLPTPAEEESPGIVADSTPSAGDKVHREEAVFSGGSRWQEPQQRREKPKSRIPKTIKRVLWIGVWVAGCSYAVGVVSEFFRTGGSSGSIQGF